MIIETLSGEKIPIAGKEKIDYSLCERCQNKRNGFVGARKPYEMGIK